ncbi:mucoidy inhibitor MuiA family protein [Kitasatospora sp. NBC_00374]|uniref:mucoidy inhibitor MuiA family protein n=1 Tax=Kitasatospora sp. NBC_00374 TaxID=2975964 RepID=UPI0030E32F07
MTGQTAGGWESELDSVTVYATGALCRRRARGVVPPDGRVRLPGLPRSLDAGSLRAKVLGAGGARVTEARLAVEAELRDPSELPELRRRVDRARDERDAALERHARRLDRVAEVSALRAVPPPRLPEEPHRRTPSDAWLELADFVDERLARLHERAAELTEELRLAEHALAVAQDELDRASNAAPARPVATGATALLTLVGADAGEIELELEYGVPGAVWVPTYRLSHRDGERTGQLVLRAAVAQRSGEDWTGVRLSLSTADLRRRTELPKLRSVRIGRRQSAPQPSGWREPPAGLADLFTGYDAVGPAPGAAPERGWPLPPPAVPAFAPPPAPVAPMPPQGYGGMLGAPAPGAAPSPSMAPAAGGGGFGGAPAADTYRKRSAAPAPFAQAQAPAPFAQASAPEPGPQGPPQPPAELLDYAALTLAGPDEPAARRGRLLPRQGGDPLAAERRRIAEQVAGLPLPGRAVRPRESAGSFDHRFDAAAPADIPSDGTWHTVAVTELPVGVTTEYVCVPAVEETVYTTLLLANETDQALLAGPVDVSVDGEHLVTAALPTLAPGDRRRVGLGPAEGIRVARRVEMRESTAGMLNNTTVLDHRVHIELASRLTRPAVVVTYERIPVTSDSDIRIEEHPGWVSPDPLSGYPPASTRTRRAELPAGGTVEFDGGFEIRIPAGKALVDGNRRS